jgi:serine/threonine protein kinase
VAANRQEDFVFAEHVLSRGYATEEQIEECLKLLERLRGELKLEESLANVLLKKGYLARAQVQTIQHALDPSKAGRPRNVIRGYQLQERIGSGAMGSVYKAHHLKLDLTVALKVLRASLASSKTQVERLKREAQLAARLNHPNIVRGLDVGESTGFHYLAMEFVDGITVRDRIRKGPLPEKEALRIARDVARALEHANQHGVIHRDVKPGNIMLTRDGRVKLADFGLARGKGPSDLTLEHASIGTPQYLAPEQAIRGANATHRSDLFGLGATLYHMVTGHPPFAGDNLSEIFQNVIRCRFAPPETVVKDLSLDTVYLIHHLMRAHPRERYATATALLADLAKLEKGESIAPPHFKGDYQKYLRRRRARWLVFGGTVTAATIAVAVLAAGYWSKRWEEDQHREFCRAANGKYENHLPKVATLAQLEELRGKLAKVPRTGCSDTEVPDLVKRTARVATELSLIEKGEAQLTAAKEKSAAFRPLHEEAKRLQTSAYLPITRERLEKIEQEIADLSRDALADQRERVRSASKRENLLAELRTLERGLRDRYVDRKTLAAVEKEADAVEALVEAWDAADRDHEQDYADALNGRDFKKATIALNQWIDALRTALRGHDAPLSEPSRSFFTIPTHQRGEIEAQERDYWRTAIEAPARQAIEEGRVDAAEDLVAPFLKRALVTRSDVQKLRDQIKDLKKATRESQASEIRKLKARIRTALEARRYLEPAALVAAEAEKPHWIPEMRRRLEILEKRAGIFTLLHANFVAKAGLEGFRAVEGDNPYVLVRRAKDKEEERLELATEDHERLVRILALDKAGLSAGTRRGYFYAAESYHDEDPRRRLAFARKALEILNETNAWTAELRERVAILVRDVKDRERDAEAFYGAMVKAHEDKNYRAALSNCRRLLEDYKYTDFVVNHLEGLKADRDDLNRRVGVVFARDQAGLPAPNFQDDVESGTTTYTFTFEEWFPDRDEDAPALVKDKQAWKERARKKYWWDRFRDWGVEEDQRKVLYERSIRQLSLFSHTLQPDLKRGGAVLAGGPHANYDLWKAGDRDDQIAIIEIQNHFADAQNWAFECVVSWDAPATEEGGKPGPSYPFYFALTAGDIQAGVLFYVFDPRPSWKEGAGRGARIFRQRGALEDLDQVMGEFLDLRRPKKLKKRKPDRAYLDSWNKEAPYLLRLECKDRDVRFFVRPLDGKKNSSAFGDRGGALLRRFSQKELVGAWHVKGKPRAKPFRIVSLVRCHLHRVVIEGRR